MLLFAVSGVKVTAMTDPAGSESWAYDSMGRVLAEQRTTNSITKTTSYAYLPYVDGSVNTITYLSGRVITYQTGLAERLLSATDSSVNYATGAHYAAPGGLAALQNGGAVNSTFIYNSRVQPCWIFATTGTALSTSTPCTATDSGPANILDLKYNYNLGTADNGDVAGITNDRDSTRSQNFTYDALNRILTAETTSTFATSPSHCWGEAYQYDNQASGAGAWGNLTDINVASSSYNGCTQESLSVTATAQNQLSGYGYDTAGNMTSVPGSGTYTYNAENQVTQATGSPATSYVYDGDGKRVEKVVSGTVTKIYSYGMGSDALDETDGTGTITNSSFHEYIFFSGKRIARRDSSGNVDYYISDHLGTSRVVTNSSGSILDDSDFYPFGGERVVTSSSGNTYKFTAKERDSETDNDYFFARYYASSMGRLISPDGFGGHLEDPQTLNRYSYVANSPLSRTDPDGHDFYLQCSSSNHNGCTQVQTDPKNSKSTQWVQAGADGNPTIITSDSIRAGQNAATINDNGLQINGSQSIYFDNPASHATDANGNDVNRNTLDIAGGGDLKGFNFHVDGNCGGTCQSSGEWSAPGMTSAQARETLNDHSFTIPFENVVSEMGGGAHPFSTQFRFGGSMLGCAVSSCPNTPHLSVPFDPASAYPKYSVPATGEWHVDGHSGWLDHARDIQNTH